MEGYPLQFHPFELDDDRNAGPLGKARSLSLQADAETRVLSLLARYHQELSRCVLDSKFRPLSLSELSSSAPRSLLRESLLGKSRKSVGASKRLAKQEYAWLETQFTSLLPFLSAIVNPFELSRVLVVGVACWFAFWQRWFRFSESNGNAGAVESKASAPASTSEDKLQSPSSATSSPPAWKSPSTTSDHAVSLHPSLEAPPSKAVRAESPGHVRSQSISNFRFFDSEENVVVVVASEFAAFAHDYDEHLDEHSGEHEKCVYENIDISSTSTPLSKESSTYSTHSSSTHSLDPLTDDPPPTIIELSPVEDRVGEKLRRYDSLNGDPDLSETKSLGKGWFKAWDGAFESTFLHQKMNVLSEKLQLSSLNENLKSKFSTFRKPRSENETKNENEQELEQKSTSKDEPKRRLPLPSLIPVKEKTVNAINHVIRGWWGKKGMNSTGEFQSQGGVPPNRDWKLKWKEVPDEDLNKSRHNASAFPELFLSELFMKDKVGTHQPSHSNAICQLGLAAALFPRSPVVSSTILLRLLSQSGSTTYGESESSSLETNVSEESFRRFVLACLLNLLKACNPSPDPSFREKDEKGSVPSRLTELAEVTAGDAMAFNIYEGRILLACREADFMYPLTGPGVMAILLASFIQNLPNLWPHDLIQLAEELESWGCMEAGFRVRIKAIQSLFSEPNNFHRVVELAIRETGIVSVPHRLEKLQESVLTALSQAKSTEFGKAYTKHFSDAIIEPLLKNPELTHGSHLARIYLSAINELVLSVNDSNLLELIETNKLACARAICHERFGSLMQEEKLRRLESWILSVDNPSDEMGWLEWKEIGNFIEKEVHLGTALVHMWKVSIFENYKFINIEGTGKDRTHLELFDWGLEGSLCEFVDDSTDISRFVDELRLFSKRKSNPLNSNEPSFPLNGVHNREFVVEPYSPVVVNQDMALLHEISLSPRKQDTTLNVQHSIHQEDHECNFTDILLKCAARMSTTIFWKWKKRKESDRFIAKLLKFLHDQNLMTKDQFNIAIQIATRIWGWTMPGPQAITSRCENPQEARELMENAIVAMWNSIATWKTDGPITCVGESWPL